MFCAWTEATPPESAQSEKNEASQVLRAIGKNKLDFIGMWTMVKVTSLQMQHLRLIRDETLKFSKKSHFFIQFSPKLFQAAIFQEALMDLAGSVSARRTLMGHQ